MYSRMDGCLDKYEDVYKLEAIGMYTRSTKSPFFLLTSNKKKKLPPRAYINIYVFQQVTSTASLQVSTRATVAPRITHTTLSTVP